MKKYSIAGMMLNLGLAFYANTVRGEIFFDTGAIDTGKGYSISGLQQPGPQVVGDSVITQADWQLDNLTIASWHLSGPTMRVTIYLMDDNAGRPGTTLDAWDVDITTTPGTLTSVATVSAPVLAANTPYWLVMFPSTDDQAAGWNLSTQTAGLLAWSADGGMNWNTVVTNLGTLILDGTRLGADKHSDPLVMPVIDSGGQSPRMIIAD